ncbi:glutamic acid-rich protein-like [Penaeus japonicus]|uniref:glutamic acid-rich protein-like n=1 Tax=Penaeus japonicus TaxID=27405 RepID=UPI001C7105DB|nr:glutamic acid-rich protein-like [Penaeus japonicus]
MVDATEKVSNGTSPRGRGGFRGRRGGPRGGRGNFAGARKFGQTNRTQEFDKTALYVEFENKPSAEDVKQVLQAVKGANSVKLGKFVQMYFKSEKEAEDATTKIKDIGCENGTLFVNKAFVQVDSPKRILPDEETKPNKKAKKEQVKEVEEEEEDDDEDEEEEDDEEEGDEEEEEDDDDEEEEEDDE